MIGMCRTDLSRDGNRLFPAYIYLFSYKFPFFRPKTNFDQCLTWLKIIIVILGSFLFEMDILKNKIKLLFCPTLSVYHL